MTENFGLILEDVKPQDWYYGGQGDFFTPLTSQKLIDTNDWSPWLPIVEYQNNNGFDRMACVTYSHENTVETIEYFKTGKRPNYSDRYIATLSGTTHQGNSVTKVFDTTREFGLVAEEALPDNATNWDEYYDNKKAEALISQGKKFLDKYDLYREFVPTYKKDVIFEALNHAPLQVIVKYDSGDGILNPVGNYNHSVMCFKAEYGKWWGIFDHYQQVIKKYDWNYEFGMILKPTLNLKTPPMFTPKNNELYMLVEGPEQKLAMGLDGKLVIYKEKVDTLINSSSRSGAWKPAVPLTLAKWNSVKHVDGKGNPV